LSTSVRIIPAQTKLRALNNEFYDLAKQLTKMVQAAIALAGLDKTSNLYKNALVEFGVSSGDLQMILYLERYAIYVDKGRRPGAKRPPFSVIRDWIIRKKINRKFRNAKGQYMSNDTIAFIICRSIGIKGIKARPFLDETQRIMDNAIEYIIDHNLIDILLEDLNQNLTP